MYYVYIFRSINEENQMYTGYTQDLKNRIDDHNSGKSKHTCKYKPWKLVFYSAFESKQQALDFEKYLKMLKQLSIYIHYPFCESKCPYCDFNSHEHRDKNNGIPESAYIDALIADLELATPKV